MSDLLWVLLVVALWLGGVFLTLGLCRAASRRPRLGGYVTPPASSGPSLATRCTTPLTRRVAAYSSSSTAPVPASEAAATQPPRAAPSRRGAPTVYGLPEGGSLGLRLRDAGSDLSPGDRAMLFAFGRALVDERLCSGPEPPG